MSKTQFRDTHPDAEAAQIALFRRMGIDGRMRLTFQLCDGLRQTVESGIRHRHPEYDERMVRLARLRLYVGAELFARCLPGCDVVP